MFLAAVVSIGANELAAQTRPAADYSHANMALLLKQADKNDAAAQTELGRRHLFGIGMKPDPATALSWFGKAAAAGSGEALFELYLCCRDGIGEAKNDEKAAKLLAEAVEHEYIPAVVATAERDFKDGASEEKIRESFKKIADLAKHGEPWAQLAQARAQARGFGPRSGGGDAIQLLLKAAAAEDPRIALAAARLFRDGESSLRPDPKRAAMLLRRLAEKGVREAAIDLARLSPDSYRGLAREQSVDRVMRDSSLIGESICVDGELAMVSDKAWKMSAGENKPPLNVTPDATELKDVESGRIVRVWGVVEEIGAVRAMLVEVPQPKHDLKYELTAPRVVKGANKEKYVVQGQLRNTGKQLIKEAKIEIRVFQPDSGKEDTKTVTVKNLRPNESKLFIESFEPTAVTAAGNFTEVFGEAKVGEVEW